jgi:SAM-dependent methyltransferase
VKAVPYLNHNRYYGIDLSPSLIAAARREIEAIGCGDKLNRRSLHVTGDFKPSVDMPPFDFVIAQSVFTHLPIAKWGQALDALAGKLAPGGKFYATFFVAPYNTPELFHERGGVTTYADRDPFHHHQQGIIDQAIYRCWRVNFIGDWNHPRDQQICELTLVDNG